MKNNMVQELLLKALLANPKVVTEAFAKNAMQTSQPPQHDSQQSKRDVASALLRSLYSNNAQIQNNSNIKKTNDTKVQTQEKTPPVNGNLKEMLEIFAKENPNFFKDRQVLQNYLIENIVNCDAEELNKIKQIADELENGAIKRFCAQNPKYEEFLAKENEKTLNKLENIGNEEFEGNLQTNKAFSAEEISKMTSDEFLKHKKEIDAQINAFLSK